MRYVMSDLHGMYDKFIEMLDKINFSENDELYILGDIFDRGKDSIKILEYIWSKNNIFLIKGNHEHIFEKCYEDESNIPLWFHNGGRTTYLNLEMKDKEFIYKTYNYIKNLPLIMNIDEYILVHAGLYIPDNYKELTINEIINLQTEEDLLWNRELINNDKYIEGYTIILGHTPTIGINNSPNIITKKGKILIDCGAVFEQYDGKLSCLCLEDKTEYYV